MKQTINFLLLACCCLAGTFTTSAQVLVQEDFTGTSGTTPPTGWDNVTTVGNATIDQWDFSNTQNYFVGSPLSSPLAVFDSYNSGFAGGPNNGQPETVDLESPGFSSTGLSDLVLEFDHFLLRISNNVTVFADVSTDGGTNWSTVWQRNTSTTTPEHVAVNLNASFNNQANLKLRFRWQQIANANNNGYWMVDNVLLFSRLPNDLAVTGVTFPQDLSCPDANQTVRVEVTNRGTNVMTNAPVKVDIDGPGVNTSFTDNIASLAPNASTIVFTTATINTNQGGSFNFKAYTQAGTDDDRGNDTLDVDISTAPAPAAPGAPDVDKCGVGSVTLTANTNPGDQTVWYDQASGGNEVGTGNPFATPFINTTTTFYAENTRELNRNLVIYNGPYRYNAVNTGTMYDVTINNEIILDSIETNIANAGDYELEIYYKVGSYVGSQTNQSAWTFHDRDTVTSNGLNDLVMLHMAPLRLAAGQTYGIYIKSVAINGVGQRSLAFKLGSLSYSNSDLTLQGGAVSNNPFTAVLNGYTGDGILHYRKVCSSNREGITAVIIPLPQNAQWNASSTFQGTYASGTTTDPDLVVAGDTLIYELNPPTGFTNNDFGTTWDWTSITFETTNGTVPPASDFVSAVPTSTTNGTFRFSPGSTYTDSTLIMTLNLRDNNTGCDTVMIREIYVAPEPIPGFIFNEVCDGDIVSFTDTSSILRGNFTHHWDFGDGNTSVQPNPNHQYASSGIYPVTLTLTSGLGITASTTVNVEVAEIPVTDFRPIFACESDSVELINLSTISTGTAGLTYEWILGDGSTNQTTQDVKHQYAAPGGYQVTLIADYNNCASQVTKTVYQFPDPVADFTTNAGCDTDPVLFTNNSTISNGTIGYRWDFGDGATAEVETPIHQYDQSGIYDVKMVVYSYFGCADSTTVQVNVAEVPQGAFTANDVCQGDTTFFVNGSSGGGTLTYLWDFGDGVGTSNQDNPSYVYPNVGTAVPSCIVTNGSCSTQVFSVVEVYERPTASFVANNVCEGESVNFNNTSTISSGQLTYEWDFDAAGQTSSMESPDYLYAAPGVYDVAMKVTTGVGCADSVNQVIEVYAIPSSDFNFTIGAERTVNFTAVSPAGNNLEWRFGDAATSTQAAPTYQYFYDGVFEVTLIVTSSEGCESITTKQVPISSVGVDNPIALLESKFKVFPNPTIGLVNIELEDIKAEKVSLVVQDLLGKELMQVPAGALTIGLNENVVDLSALANGVYLLKINYGDIVVTKRMTKNN